MRTIQISDAETSFHRLIAAVEAGEELALTRHGRVVARMLPGIPCDASASSRRRWGDVRAIEQAHFTLETGLVSPLD